MSLQLPFQQNLEPDPNSTITNFKAHIPKWGGTISFNGENVMLTNTCTIDYFLFAFWVLEKLVPHFLENIPNLEKTPLLKEIIQAIDIYNWNKAKEIWIVKIMNYIDIPIQNTISMFGSVNDRFIRYLSEYQRYRVYQTCDSCNQNRIEIRESNNLDFLIQNNNVILDYGYMGTCLSCSTELSCEIHFLNNPNFLFIESITNNIFVNALPKVISINENKYRLLCAKIGLSGHFVAIFDINNNFFIVDDIGQRCTFLPVLNQVFIEKRNTKYPELFYRKSTSHSLYYLIE